MKTGTGLFIPVDGTAEELAALAAEIGKKVKAAAGGWPVGTWHADVGPKPLPRDPATGTISRTFIANGTEYLILGENGIGIERWSQYEKSSISLSFNRTFQAIYQYIIEGLNSINAAPDINAVKLTANRHFLALMDSIKDLSESRYSMAFWICTLFIVRRGEDITRWEEKEQEEKIKDWKAENISEGDFFLLAASGQSGLVKTIQRLREESRRLQQQLMGVTGTTETENQEDTAG